MKITSGAYKYRNLEIPDGIRPTTEKVREAIFSMIRDWIPGAMVLDLFAGSGALGLEALSRGADRCCFNEGNRRNYKVLLSNIANCRAEDKSEATNYDYIAALSRATAQFDIVLLDPPYDHIEYYVKTLEILQERDLLTGGGIVVAEHLYDNKLSDTYGKLTRIKEKKYGTIGVDVFEVE